MISSLQDSGRESNGTADSNPDSRPVGVRPHRAPNLVSGRERTLGKLVNSICFHFDNVFRNLKFDTCVYQLLININYYKSIFV
jgi:hypothetical protein